MIKCIRIREMNRFGAQPCYFWTVACQAPLSMEFFRQEYWNGLPYPPPGDLLEPGTEPQTPALQADSLPSEPPGKPLLGHKSIHL